MSKSSQLKKEILKSYQPLADSIAKLLDPYAEVVIHDLSSGKIACLYNNFSKRKVGDPSLLESELDLRTLPDNFGPYIKMNWNGKKLKSISTTIRDSDGKPIGLLCINLDISVFEDVISRIQTFNLSLEKNYLPTALFAEDWREKINLFIGDYLRERKLQIHSLSRENKIKLIKDLRRLGGFRGSKSAEYIGSILNISKASVYSYLKE